MGQAELAEDLSNSVMFTHGTVYSSRDRVNVIVGPGEGNHFYPRLRGGNRIPAIRALIRDALAMVAQDVPHGWAATRTYVVFVREDYSQRGRYTFSVWSEDRIIVRQFDNTRWHSNGVAGDAVFRSTEEAESYAARIRPHLRPGQSVAVLSRDASARQFEL